MEKKLGTHNDSRQVIWECANAARGVTGSNQDERILALAYIAYLVKNSKDGLAPEDAIKNAPDRECADFLAEYLRDGGSDAAVHLAKSFSSEELKTVVLSDDAEMSVFAGEHSTPSSIVSLALDILDIKPEDSVVDLCCGRGNFLSSAIMAQPHAAYSGIEINRSAACVTKIRTSLLDAQASIKNEDVFCGLEPGVADKAFSNFPFGMKISNKRKDNSYLDYAVLDLSGRNLPASADWFFAYMLFDSITNSGKAVGIMTGSPLFNTTDERVRRYFVENGMIEAVIALPARLFTVTGINVFMIVFSHENERIRFIDASDICHQERRKNIIDNSDIQIIDSLLACDGDKSKSVDYDEIAKTDFNLSPLRYFRHEIKLKNAVPFSDIIISVTRGASLRAAELDELITKDTTGIEYLMLSDIEDGRINRNLPNLKKLDPKLEKYCLRNGDLLISKNGSPFKVAVVEIPEGIKILANGNLYIVRLNSEKADPSYVAAFLRGSVGRELMSQATVGATIPSLSLKGLEGLPIPLRPLAEQQEIAAKFQAKLDEVALLKMKVENTRLEAMSLFDEEA